MIQFGAADGEHLALEKGKDATWLQNAVRQLNAAVEWFVYLFI